MQGVEHGIHLLEIAGDAIAIGLLPKEGDAGLSHDEDGGLMGLQFPGPRLRRDRVYAAILRLGEAIESTVVVGVVVVQRRS